MGAERLTVMTRRSSLWRNRIISCLYYWLIPFCDPLRFLAALRGLPWFLANLRAYSRLPGAEPLDVIDTWPQLHDRTGVAPFDAHYYYVNGWAIRRILANRPTIHVDVASQIVFSSLLSAVMPTVFLDYRPLNTHLSGLYSLRGSILQMPFPNNAVESLSCLHVAEHIGLGRYGDQLDPSGTMRAAQELARVVQPGGNLFFAVPVGEPRLLFNSCRIFAASTICDYFSGMDLIEFSGVRDDGRFVEDVDLTEFNGSSYACGFFWFRKPQPPTARWKVRQDGSEKAGMDDNSAPQIGAVP